MTQTSNEPRTSDPVRPVRRPLRLVLVSAGVALLMALGSISYWALDRFVIDHVEITDVSALEAEAEAALAAVATNSEAATVVAAASSGDAAGVIETVITDSSYVGDNAEITITEYTSGSGSDTVTYYVADVVLSDATALQSAFAADQFGTNIVDYTSSIAEDNNAIFAINGDYYGFRDSGILIRNGVVYRDDGARVGLAVYLDGTMEIYDETETSAQELLEAGVWNTISFGPGIVDDGEIVDGIGSIEVDTNFGNHSIQGTQPRTGIGMISENHFVFVVVDGRSAGYSRGVTMTEFAEIFVSLGATEAYNLDGGGSSTMYFNGELVNNPLGRNRERGTSDIFYVEDLS